MFLFGEQTPRDWNRTPQEWRSLTPTLTSLQKRLIFMQSVHTLNLNGEKTSLGYK